MTQGTTIGFWTCTALVVGNVIGMGIFLLPASLAPFGLNAMIGWGITLLGCLALAQVLARLARALPEADGPYGYIRRGLGELPAFMATWSYWLSVWLTNAALATGVVGYLAVVFPPLVRVQPAVLALLLQWTLVAVNLAGVRASGGVQIVTTALKLLPMLAIALLGGWVLLTAPTSYVAHPPATPIGLGAVTSASTIALFAMIGFESASLPAARVLDPGRTIPRATMIGTVLVAVIYLVICAVPLLLIPQAELARSSAPLSLLVERYGHAGAGRWLALFVAVSGLGALNGWTLLAGEITRTMAVNGVLPAVLARRNRQGTPVIALLVTGLLASVMIWMSYSASLVAAFTLITLMSTAASLPLYLGCALALWMLARRRQAGPGGGAALAVAGAGLAYGGFAIVGIGGTTFLYALGLIAAGLPLYALMRLRRRAPAPAKA